MSTIEYLPTESWKRRTSAAILTTVAACIESLKDKSGFVSRERVLEHARDPESPLHRFFTWDDSKAAEKYRLIQARKLITCYVVRVIGEDNKPIIIHPANVHVRTPDFASRFVSAPQAMSDQDQRLQVLSDSVKQLDAIQARLAALEGITPAIIDILERAKQLLEGEKKKKPKKKPLK